MKFSMWLIAEKLKKYDPECDIKDGPICITGVRLVANASDTSPDSQYVYLHIGANNMAILANGRDHITIHSCDVHVLLNDLLSLFDFYNSWEIAIRAAAADKSFQHIIDLAHEALENPMMVSDIKGNVLAMSTAFINEDINEYWASSRDSGHIPTMILSAPKYSKNGIVVSWTDTPEIYIMPDGTKTIGTFLCVDGEPAAGLGLWEYRRPITSFDISLIKVLCDVLIAANDVQESHVQLRTNTSVIADLLSGIQIDNELIKRLSLKCKKPWQLWVIDNPFRRDVMHKHRLIHRMRTSNLPNIPLLYEDHVIILVSEANALNVYHYALSGDEKQFALAGLSLSFDDLRHTAIRYQQTLFAMKQSGGMPGVCYSEKHIFSFLLSRISDHFQSGAFIHPALFKLKSYDAKKQSELYQTLYHYLMNERRPLSGSQAMHVHKNTFMYRLSQIRSIINADLDDPMVRTYLLLSYLLDEMA